MSGENDKVTLAVLGTKIDRVQDDVTEIKANQEKDRDRIRAVETEQARQKGRSNIQDGLVAAFALAMGALGIKQ